MTINELHHFEEQLRAHPMVAPRLQHKRDMLAADAAVKHYIYGEPYPDPGWAKTGTAQQVKSAYDQLLKQRG
jgi:hypothetical protein